MNLFFKLLKILRKIPYIQNINFIESFLVQRVGELQDGDEVLFILEPHTNIHFWIKDGAYLTSKEYHMSRGGDEDIFDIWAEEKTHLLE